MKDQKASELITAGLVKILQSSSNPESGIEQQQLQKDLAKVLGHVVQFEKAEQPFQAKEPGTMHYWHGTNFVCSTLDKVKNEFAIYLNGAKIWRIELDSVRTEAPAPDISTKPRYGFAGIDPAFGKDISEFAGHGIPMFLSSQPFDKTQAMNDFVNIFNNLNFSSQPLSEETRERIRKLSDDYFLKNPITDWAKEMVNGGKHWGRKFESLKMTEAPECSNHAPKKSAAAEPTINVRVIKGDKNARWYNELKGQIIQVNNITAGIAYKLDCGPKYKHTYGTIPARHFELITDGVEYFEVCVTKRSAEQMWYKIGTRCKVKPVPVVNGILHKLAYHCIDQGSPAFVYAADVIIEGAKYKPVGVQMTEAFKKSPEALKGVADIMKNSTKIYNRIIMQGKFKQLNKFMESWGLPENHTAITIVYDGSAKDEKLRAEIQALLLKYNAVNNTAPGNAQ